MSSYRQSGNVAAGCGREGANTRRGLESFENIEESERGENEHKREGRKDARATEKTARLVTELASRRRPYKYSGYQLFMKVAGGADLFDPQVYSNRRLIDEAWNEMIQPRQNKSKRLHRKTNKSGSSVPFTERSQICSAAWASLLETEEGRATRDYYLNKVKDYQVVDMVFGVKKSRPDKNSAQNAKQACMAVTRAHEALNSSGGGQLTRHGKFFQCCLFVTSRP